MSEDPDDLHHDLIDLVDRFVAETVNTEEQVEFLQRVVYEEPAEAAAILLGGYAVGDWDLTEQDLAHLWLIGHAMGYSREQLLHDLTLAEAAPGRDTRPPTPPGYGPPLLAGGGHGAGKGGPGKREFPSSWSDDEVIARTMDVAQQPSGTVELPSGDFRASGERNGVSLSVLVSAQGSVLTSYPVSGDGVVQNPLDDERLQAVRDLEALVDAVPDGPRADLDELMDVGEWPHVISCLRALDLPWTEQQRAMLDDLAAKAGLPRDA